MAPLFNYLCSVRVCKRKHFKTGFDLYNIYKYTTKKLKSLLISVFKETFGSTINGTILNATNCIIYVANRGVHVNVVQLIPFNHRLLDYSKQILSYINFHEYKLILNYRKFVWVEKAAIN